VCVCYWCFSNTDDVFISLFLFLSVKGLAKSGITSVGGKGGGKKAQTFCGTPQYLGMSCVRCSCVCVLFISYYY